jgi:hypothetical protein
LPFKTGWWGVVLWHSHRWPDTIRDSKNPRLTELHHGNCQCCISWNPPHTLSHNNILSISSLFCVVSFASLLSLVLSFCWIFLFFHSLLAQLPNCCIYQWLEPFKNFTKCNYIMFKMKFTCVIFLASVRTFHGQNIVCLITHWEVSWCYYITMDIPNHP